MGRLGQSAAGENQHSGQPVPGQAEVVGVTVKLEFDGEETDRARRAMSADQMAGAAAEFDRWLRAEIKYGIRDGALLAVLEEARDKHRECWGALGVSWED